jgi:uncharacterized membrane protein
MSKLFLFAYTFRYIKKNINNYKSIYILIALAGLFLIVTPFMFFLFEPGRYVINIITIIAESLINVGFLILTYF